MAAGLIAPIMPDVAEEFEFLPNSDLLSKLLLSVPALFIALTAPFSGYLIDRYGRLPLLYLGLILYATSGSSGYYLQDLYYILIGRAFLGISIGIIMTVTITLIGDHFEGDQRRRFIGQQSAFIGFSGVAFLSISGILAEVSWRIPFLLYFFPLLLIPFVISSLKGSSGKENTLEKISWKRLHPATYFLFFSGAMIMMIMYLIPTQLPFLLKKKDIINHTVSGNILAFHALGMVLSSLSYPWLKKRSKFVSVYVLGFVLMGLSYFILGQIDNITAIISSVFLGGISFGLLISNTNLWTIEITRPEQRGRIVGLLTSCLFLGQFIAPLVAEPVVRNAGFGLLFKVFAGISASFATVLFIYTRLYPRDQAQDP